MYYIKKAKLDGYKNINKVNIDLYPGLNVIIGKNGVGKTNFLQFLDNSVRMDLSSLLKFNIKLDINTEKDNFLEIKAMKTLPKNLKDNMIFGSFSNDNFDISITLDNKVILDNKVDRIYSRLQIFRGNNIKIGSTFIKHGIFNESPILDKSVNFSISSDETSQEFINFLNDPNITYMCQSLLLDVHNKISQSIRNLNKNSKNLKDKILLESQTIINTLKKLLIKYNIVVDISISDSFQISYGKNEIVKVENLFLIFKIDEEWYKFSELSDGLKRIIHIFLELAFIKENTHEALVLLEEPELGIHPHLIDKLMTFIKEVSQDVQIIITTHSPQILDYLDKDELDRIIIASSENNNTKLKHLTKKQIKDATLFLENESNLSDYWMHSDLEV